MPVFFAPIVNFVTVLAVFFIFGRKPIGAMFVSRSETVKKEMDEAEKAFLEASKAFRQWDTSRQEKEAHAVKELEDTKASVVRQKERTVASAKTEAERIKKEAQMMGTNEVAQAKESLQRELAEKSIGLAEEFLGKQLDGKEKEKLIIEYVGLVGSGPS